MASRIVFTLTSEHGCDWTGKVETGSGFGVYLADDGRIRSFEDTLRHLLSSLTDSAMEFLGEPEPEAPNEGAAPKREL